MLRVLKFSQYFQTLYFFVPSSAKSPFLTEVSPSGNGFMQVKQFSHRKICVKRNKDELMKTILRSHEADKGRPAGHVD